MTRSNSFRRRTRRRGASPLRSAAACTAGQALVEAALILPLLLILVLALIESGNGLSIKHKMAVLTREGANIASRGSSLQETLDVVMNGGAEIDLSAKGGAIISRIVVTGGTPVVANQLASSGFEERSRLGLPDSTSVALESIPLAEGQVLYAVEIIFDYEAMTPLAGLFARAVTDEVYERAIF